MIPPMEPGHARSRTARRLWFGWIRFSVPAGAFLVAVSTHTKWLPRDSVPVFRFLQVASGKWRIESSSGSLKSSFWISGGFLLFFVMVLLISRGQDDVSQMGIVMNQSLGYRILEDPLGFLIDSKNQAPIDQALERYEELVRLVTGVEQTLENARKGVPWARSCSPGPTN